MKITEVLGQEPFSSALEIPVVGLDIGSRASKGVLIKGNEIVTVLVPTGLYTQETARRDSRRTVASDGS
jgi:activator of 2-hydroxyglutaryl-CoA dehydratase